MCSCVNSTPYATGSIGMSALAYSDRLAIASAQKCGGVHAKMIRNNSSECGSADPVTAVQPSTGGAAPAAPPITMFCGVTCLSQTVYSTAYPISDRNVSTAVSGLTSPQRTAMAAGP